MAASKRKPETQKGTAGAPRKKVRIVGNSPGHSVSCLAKHEAAIDLVFSITELLENIVIHLPPKDLYVAQRVSHQFKDTIARCPDVQKKLWIRVDHALCPVVCALLLRHDHAQTLLVRSEDSQRIKRERMYQFCSSINQIAALRLNPVLSASNRNQNYTFENCDTTARFRNFKIPRGDGPPLWSTAHLCLPPIAPACIRFSWSIKSAVKGEGEREIDEKAITLGAVIEHIFDGELHDIQSDSVQERKKQINMESARGLRSVVERLEEKYKAPMVVDSMDIIFQDAVVPTEKEWQSLGL